MIEKRLIKQIEQQVEPSAIPAIRSRLEDLLKSKAVHILDYLSTSPESLEGIEFVWVDGSSNNIQKIKASRARDTFKDHVQWVESLRTLYSTLSASKPVLDEPISPFTQNTDELTRFIATGIGHMSPQLELGIQIRFEMLHGYKYRLIVSSWGEKRIAVTSMTTMDSGQIKGVRRGVISLGNPLFYLRGEKIVENKIREVAPNVVSVYFDEPQYHEAIKKMEQTILAMLNNMHGNASLKQPNTDSSHPDLPKSR